MERFFPYACDDRFKMIWWPLGVRPGEHGVRVGDEEFVATYGRFTVRTPRSNVSGAHITRDYRWWTAVGIRMSFVDDGLTFGTNPSAGVCVHFDERIGPVLGHRRHSALTVTVEDLEGLVEVLGAAPPRGDG